MKISKHSISSIFYVLIFLVVCSFLSCHNQHSDSDHPDESFVNVGILRGPSSIAFAEWMQNPPKIDGKKVRIRVLDSPEIMQASIIKGETSIGILPMMNAISLINKGIELEILGCPIWGTLYIIGQVPTLSDVKNIHIFGKGSSPAFLAQFYLENQGLHPSINYTLSSPVELVSAFKMGQVSSALLSEPFVSIMLQSDPTLKILADINKIPGSEEVYFPQTAVVCSKELYKSKNQIDRLLDETCNFANEHPASVINILENNDIFKKGVLTPESIERCKIKYETVQQAKHQINEFVKIMQSYAPESVGKSIGLLFVSSDFYKSVSITIFRGLIGILVSFLCAFLFAWSFYKIRWIERLISPLISILRSIPVISFILLALIFINNEAIPLLIAFLTMFPLLTENLTKGLKNSSRELSQLGIQFSVGRCNRFTQIVYPQVKPYLFSGLASAMGFGWRAIIMGEVLAQCDFGIGTEMKKAQTFISVPDLIAWTVVAIIISFLFDKLIRSIERFNFKIYFEKNNYATFPTVKCISLNNINFNYESKTILKNFNYTFNSGTVYGLSAPSGTGKTTLLGIIDGSLQPISGTISPMHLKHKSVVFQTPNLLTHLNVADNIILPLSSSFSRKKALARIQHWVNILEIDSLLDNYPSELSYGQQQRVAIARAMVFPTGVILMDEPFKGLESVLSDRIVKAMKQEFCRTQSIVVFASHDEDILYNLADEVLRL